jgi:hypothetical protein
MNSFFTPQLAQEQASCHGRISDGRRYVGTVAGWIGYRAIYVQESKPVVGSMDRM